MVSNSACTCPKQRSFASLSITDLSLLLFSLPTSRISSDAISRVSLIGIITSSVETTLGRFISSWMKIRDLTSSLKQLSGHAEPATPGCHGIPSAFSNIMCCLRHQSKTSAHPLSALLRVCLTMLHLVSLFVSACRFASRYLIHRGIHISLCRPASGTTVTRVPLDLATCLAVSNMFGLSPIVVCLQRRTLWDNIISGTVPCSLLSSPGWYASGNCTALGCAC